MMHSRDTWTDPALFGREKMPPQEELRFFRLIDEREGSTLTLACNHVIKTAAPPPAKQQYAFCEMCQRNWSENPLNQ